MGVSHTIELCSSNVTLSFGKDKPNWSMYYKRIVLKYNI